MDNKRRMHRVPLELKTKVASSHAQTLPSEQTVKTRDISTEGMRLETPLYDPLGEEIQGEISIPGQDDPIRFKAKVKWNRPHDAFLKHCGLEFTEMPESDLRRLESFVKSVFMQSLTFY